MSEIYTYQDGSTTEIPAIPLPKKPEECFKIVLPDTKEEELTGNGEDLWACTTEENFSAWQNDGEGIYFVKILNNSYYYPGLKEGTVIPVQFLKLPKPVAMISELEHHYGPSRRNEVTRFLKNQKKNNMD
ncbi:hypothetical protein CN918_25870 [Priestia megaterium]|nr:hypothetical protein CN918_25870 [Priestia megaterium]